MQATQLPPPMPATRPPADDPSPSPLSRLPRLSPAGWLAGTGATMLLLASVVVVASQWEAITPEVRFSGLVAALLAVYFVAEASRQRFASTSTALATLAATMTAPVGIAAAASLGQTWPTCVLVGGLTALVATEAQSARWDVPVLKAATVAATGLGSAGLAALTGIPVALIVAGAAVTALVLGASRRSVALGAAVGFSPILLALSEAGIGPGTLADIGATGQHLAWSAPVAAAAAALVLAINAHHRNEIVLGALAAATVGSGVIVGMVHADASTIAWWSLPAILLIVVELAALSGPDSIWRSAANAVRPVALLPVALGGLFAPVMASLSVALTDFGGDAADRMWAIPLGLTCGALAVAAVGADRWATGSCLFAVTFASAASAGLATVIVVSPDGFGWLHVGAFGCIAVATGMVGRGRQASWGHVAALQSVAVVGLSLGVARFTADQAAVLLMALAVTLTGIAFIWPAVTPVDTAALSAGALVVLVAMAGSPAVGSLAMITISTQALMYTLARQQPNAAKVAAAVIASSWISLWWTSGTNDLVIRQIEPYGADGADVALCAATLALLVTGWLSRRLQGAATWLAYSPGLGMAAAWLLQAQLDTDATWATLGALTVGLIATGVGGLRRLAAPLVIGTGLIGATVVISAGHRLAEAPTWLWIAGGGVMLLALAAVIEQTDRSVFIAGPEDDDITLLQQFRQDFE